MVAARRKYTYDARARAYGGRVIYYGRDDDAGKFDGDKFRVVGSGRGLLIRNHFVSKRLPPTVPPRVHGRTCPARLCVCIYVCACV